MNQSKLRRQIAFEAAQLLYQRQESEYYRAKLKAARRIYKGWVKPADLPSNVEIRDQVQMLARTHEGPVRDAKLKEMRLEALHAMRILASFRPRLIGSVLTGHVRHGSDIDLHVFSDSTESVAAALEREGMTFDIERKHVRKHGEQQLYIHIHVVDRFPIELTIYAANMAHYVFKSSITGKAIERASIAELERFLAREYPHDDLDHELSIVETRVDRFQVYESLLLPLENVMQQPKYHPEGDALYHSLQVFDLAKNHLPYDEEFLVAALVHDVGKAIDPRNHVATGLEALDSFISERTEWLIEHHMLVHQVHDSSIGYRAHRRLAAHESYEELLLLGECDRLGRQVGVATSDVDDAVDYLRDLSLMCGG
jgi:predicted nucleotidyltransferase